jgi:uncharacterized protein (DUF58 family)
VERLIDRQKIRSLGGFEFLAKQAVEGFITGMHKSPFHGFSVEFADHRLYNKGESTKHIDWKLYARTDKLFIKRYEEETNLRCQLVIDASSSMYFPDKLAWNKINFSAHAAATLSYLFRKQRDAVGLSFFSDKLELHTPAKSNLAHHRFVYAELEKMLFDYDTTSIKTTSVSSNLHAIAENIARRSLVCIFSDMLSSENTDDIFSALQHLRHAKHEVIVFHVRDKEKEVNLDFDNRPYTFVDMESGESIKLNPNQYKDQYKEMADLKKKALKLKCGQYMIDFVDCDINAGYDNILLQYLIKRQKMV